MRWPNTVIIRRAGEAAGTQNTATGVFVPSTTDGPVVLYDGYGDLQHRRRTVRRADDGDKMVQSEADLYLEDETDLDAIEEGCRVEIIEIATEKEYTAQVLSINALDGIVFVDHIEARPIEVSTPDEEALLATDYQQPLKP